MRLLDALEVTDRDKRLKVARAILYLAQGGCGQPATVHFDHSQGNRIRLFGCADSSER